ncbi:MAG: Na+/H+ antiporter subunit E [Erysipelotrichaceae bacterium]|nr:Na+/H+ antiporter subunit E [Erysipelotrichaceae bacterium]
MHKKTKISLFLYSVMMLFWLILIPRYTIENVVAGLLVCWATLWFSSELLIEEEQSSIYSKKGLVLYFRYIYHLVIEIVKANIDVAKIVLSKNMDIQPHFFKVPLHIKKDLNKVIYANAITLTPGTLSVDMDEDFILVHALTTAAANGIEGSILELGIIELEELG